MAGRPPEPARYPGAGRPVVRGPRPARDARGDGGLLPARRQRVAPARSFFEPAASAGGGARGGGRPRHELPRARALPRPPAAVPLPGCSGSFFRALPQEVALMRTFALAPLGFAHPSIAVYATRPPRVAGAPALVPPPALRPHLERRRGVSRPRPLRPGRPHALLGGGQVHDVILARPAAVDEVVVFVLNGPVPSRVRVEVGWRRRWRRSSPGSGTPSASGRAGGGRPAPPSTGCTVGLLPEGRTALVQIRAGAREIGEAYAAWGRWEAAVPYLERALAARPGDGEILLLLGRGVSPSSAGRGRASASGRGSRRRRRATSPRSATLGKGAEARDAWPPPSSG